MDFQSLKRRELQALCKKNNLPANLTNSAMADSLSSLPFVEGLEEFMRQSEVEGAESGEISVITCPSAPRTTSRRQVTKEVLEEGSKMATRTRCGTRRRGVEGTDTRKTPATRTIRSKGFHEDSIQKKAGKDMQADFEADLESEVSETTVLSDVGKKEISEVSTVSVEQEGQSLESQNEAPNAILAVANDGKEAIEVDENLEVDGGEVHEEVEEIAKLTNASQKLDFHSLGRKDLQSLCKKNKIPANTTNVTMASALESLEIVIGLEEFIKGYDPEAALSPEMSDMRSVRRSCTGRKASKEPMSSKLMTKSSRGTRTRVMEEIEQAKKVAFETPATRSTRHKAGQTGLALCREEAAQKKEMQTQSRRGASRNVAQEMENSSMEEAEGMSDTNADVGMLLVAEAEEEVQCQLEALNIEKAADLDCVSESNNIGDDGTDGLLKIENLKQQQEPVVEDDSNLVVDVNAEGSEVTEQAGYMVNETGDSEVSEQLGGLVDERDDNVNRSADISSIVEDVNAEGSEVTAPPGDIVNENEEDSEIPEELGDLVDERDNNVDTSADISEVPEQPRNLVNRTDEIVEGITNAELQEVPEQIVNTDSENVDEDTDASLEATEECDSGSFHLTTEDSTVDLSPTEKHKGSHEEDQLLEEFDSRSITQDDELLTLNGDVKGEFEISLVEEQNTADRDAHACSVEDEDDKQKFVTDLTIAEVEPLLAVGDNLERESEKTQHENVTIPAADSIPIGKLEAFAEEKMSVKFAESTISAVQCTQKEKGTPLSNKSLRKLKKMVKEKLQETTLLAKEMEKLTLEESKTTLTKAEDLQEENVELDVESNEVAPMGKSEADDAPVFTMIIQDAGEESDDQTIGFKSDNDGDLSNALENTNTKSDANVSALFPVNILLDHELVSEDSVSGQIVVDSSMTPSKSASKPWKPLLLTTPSKSSSRTPLHSDINKENVDHSASKTEPGKIKMVVAGSGKLLSTMSMGKLKKEFKDLQQSEKRRQALQARSENCCSLSSP